MNLFPWSLGGFGWGFGAFVVSVILVGIFLIPLFFFLLNLHNLLDRVQPSNRAMPPGYVWLNFIPIFNWYWSIHTVIKVRESVQAEYRSRGWAADGDFGYSVGMGAAILFIVMSFFRWIPFVGWVVSLAWLVCWIIYWLKASELKGRIGQQDMWRASGPQGYAGGQYAPPVTPPYTPPRQAPSQQQPIPPQQPTPQPPVSAAQQPAQPPQQVPPPALGGGSPAPPVPRGVWPEPDQPAGGQPGVAEGAQGAPEAPAQGRSGGVCAACGTTYGPSDAFCRTCGMRLP